MCGIAGIHRRTEVKVERAGRFADELLVAMETRGRDSTGWLAMLDSGKVQHERSMLRASVYVYGRSRFNGDFRTLILHTRFATVGSRTLLNAHPVINGTCAAVHNGTIRNHREVFDMMATDGIKRHAQVDSEVIPAVVSWGGWENAAEALSLLDGGMATAVVSKDHPGELLLARLSGYPLHYLINDHMIVWASTRQAIQQAWTRTYGGQPVGRMVEVPSFTLHHVNGSVESHTIEDRYLEQALFRSKPTGGRKGGTRSPNALPATKAKPVSGTTAKKRRKRSRKAGRGNTLPFPSEALRSPYSAAQRYDVVNPEDMIRDYMRWTGVSREVATADLYGTWDDDASWVGL